jgi:two-component system NtrC family sensor kinase
MGLSQWAYPGMTTSSRPRKPRRGAVTTTKNARAILLVLAAAALLGALAFLFVRSAAIDFRREVETASLLRQLRAFDARLDADALRMQGELAPTPAAASQRPQLDRMLKELQANPAPTLVAAAPQLRSGLEAKLAASDAFRAAHARTLEALAAAEESAAALAAQANTLRLSSPRSGERALLAGANAEVLKAQLRTMGSAAEAARVLAPRLATLREAAAAADASLAEPAARAEAAARAYLAARGAEAAALDRLTFQTVGARTDLIAETMLQSIQGALDEQERWRVYLFFYAGALLVMVAYLVSRVIASQAALRAANEGLEKRVAERTQELSGALARLKESEAQLVQTEKMSSLGQMVAGVAHEINTPLAYVKNSVATARDRMPELRDAVAQSSRLIALMQADSPDPKDLEETFGALSGRLSQLEAHHVMDDLDSLTHDGLHGIEQISELVVNLKNFSRLDRSRVSSFNVNDGVNATLLIAKAQLKPVAVEKRLGQVPPINCSPSQVNQVLLNLVTNAAQAMDKPQGRLSITTRPIQGGVAIDVADNGKGIPPEVLPKIFDPFFTTKEVGKGTGLGLSIAYKIAQQHGGRLDVKSQVGAGTVFTLTLPITPPPELAAESPPEAPKGRAVA